MAFAKIKAIPPENAMNAVIYARYSSTNQTENSIDTQLRAAREYAEKKGFCIIGEYVDRALSGTTDNRPEFQRMVDDAKKRQFAFIIVYRFDRFSRNRYDSAIYKKKLEGYGVRVLSTEESIGTGDEGIILESIYEAMAESYSRRLSKIVTRGMREKAMKGLSTGGNIPFGLKIEDHRLVIDEDEKEGVKYAYDSYVNGSTKKQIADALNSMGYRTKRGNKFTINSVTGILQNPRYCGRNSFADIKQEIPAIISKELFDKVQDLLEKSKSTYGKKCSNVVYDLSGKIFCGYCGAAMIGDCGTSKSGATHHYYSCAHKKKHKNCKKKSEKKDFIEWYICEQAVQFVLTDARINTIADRVMVLAGKDVGDDKEKELVKSIAEAESQFNSLVDTLVKTTNPQAIRLINEKIEELDNRISNFKSELAKFRVRKEETITKKDVVDFLKSFRKGDLLDESFRHLVITTLINCVYLFDDKVVIYFNLYGSELVSHIEMLDDIESMDEEKCSDSLLNAPPIYNLSEHTALIMSGKRIGAKISRD